MLKDRTRRWFVIVFTILVVAIVGATWLGQKWQPFGGEFDDVGMVEVDGTLQRVLIFCREIGKDERGEPIVHCKHLWSIRVGSAEKVNGILVSSVPSPEEVLAVDVEDSRANLFHSLQPKECFRDRDVETGYVSTVRICEHEVTQTDVLITMVEYIGSSGQPEWSGVPR